MTVQWRPKKKWAKKENKESTETKTKKKKKAQTRSNFNLHILQIHHSTSSHIVPDYHMEGYENKYYVLVTKLHDESRTSSSVIRSLIRITAHHGKCYRESKIEPQPSVMTQTMYLLLLLLVLPILLYTVV